MTRARDLGDFIADGAAAELVVDTTTLVVDSTNNRVGIGTASPATALDVTGTVTSDGLTVVGDVTVTGDTFTITSSAQDDPVLLIQNTTNDSNSARLKFNKDRGAAAQDGDDIADIIFAGENDAQQAVTYAAVRVEAADVSDGSEDGTIAFQSMKAGTLSDSLKIDSGGDVGIGVSPSNPGWARNLQVHGAGNGGGLQLTDNTSGSGNNDGLSIASYQGNSYFINRENAFTVFSTNDTERFRIGSAGQLGIGGATYGTSGQVLTSGGSGAAPTWADAASTAITFTAQADGAIEANRMAGIESNGNMKALFNVSSGSTINVEVATEARRIQIAPVTENLYFYAWDASNSSITNHNKVALVQKSSGSVAANALTVGTIVEVNTDQPRLNDAVYDPDNQRITYFWATSGSSTINYRMYSFSGTTLTQTGSGSFSVTNLSTNYPGYMEATYNTTHNCIVLIYKTSDDGAYQIQLIDPGTTSLTLSSNTYAFGNYNSYTGRSVECAATGAHVFTVQKVSDARAYVRAGTISGSGSSLALSLGTEVDVSTSDGYGGNSPIGIFDVPENTNYTNTMCVQHANTSSYAKYCLFSLSGTTITAKTQSTPYIAAGGGDTLEGAYVKTKGFVMQTWTYSNSYKMRPINVTAATPVETGTERAISGSVSGSHGTSRTPIANGPGSDYCVTGFVYYTGSTYPKAQAIAQVDENFDDWAGYTESAVSDGATGTFTIFGPISGVTSANPQSFLYVQDDGQVTTSSNGNGAKCGIATGGGNGIIIRSREHDLYGN